MSCFWCKILKQSFYCNINSFKGMLHLCSNVLNNFHRCFSPKGISARNVLNVHNFENSIYMYLFVTKAYSKYDNNIFYLSEQFMLFW